MKLLGLKDEFFGKFVIIMLAFIVICIVITIVCSWINCRGNNSFNYANKLGLNEGKCITVQLSENEYKQAIRHLKFERDESNTPHIMQACTFAIEACEKQIAKKPVLVSRGLIKFYPCQNCSTPDKYIQVYPKQKYCIECGQRLGWDKLTS